MYLRPLDSYLGWHKSEDGIPIPVFSKLVFSEPQNTEKGKLPFTLYISHEVFVTFRFQLGFEENMSTLFTRGSLVVHGELLLPRLPGTGSFLIREKLVLHLACYSG